VNILIISRYKDSFFALPPAKVAEIGAATLAFVDKYLKSGKLKAAYGIGDRRGNVGIWDFSSEEEMARIVREYPMYPYESIEQIPLVEYKTLSKILNEAIEAAKKAK
jgi:muconolactone delta-isomerase